MASVQQLQDMDPYDFEELVGEVWEKKGYETHVRQGSQDRAIDVEAARGGERVLIQAKRYSSGNKVGADEVRKYATLWQQEPDASRIILVTTNTFTSEAKRIAAEQNVSIIGGSGFADMMEEEEVESGSSSTPQQDHSMPDSSWGRVRYLLFPPQLWQNGIIVGIIAWFILSPLLITLAGLYAGIVILIAGFRVATNEEKESTENESTHEAED